MPERLKAHIRDVPDFPKPGIVFKDITPMLGHPESLRRSIDLLAARAEAQKPDKIVAIDSRGFIFGSGVAYRLGIGMVPARKKGKLPAKVVRAEYQLEYGTDILELHADAIKPGERVIVMDDVLATGGTASAVGDLVRQVGGVLVEYAFVIELGFLGGRKKLEPHGVSSLLAY